MAATYISNPGSDSGPHAQMPDWHEILVIVMERFWFGLAVALAVFLFVFFRLTQAVPYYRSTAVLMVEASQLRVLNYQDVVVPNVRSLDYFNTVIQLLHSQKMMEKALEQSGLDKHPGFLPGVEGLRAKAAAALGLVTIQALDRTRLIHISVEYTDPVIASELANAMANAYIRQELENRMTASMQAVEWLKLRSVEYREKLEQGMQALQEYRENAQSVSLEEDQNIVIAKLKSLNESLTAAQTERIDAQSRWESIKSKVAKLMPIENPDNLNNLKMIVPELNNAVLSESLSRLGNQQQQVSQLRERYKPQHPDFKAALQLENRLNLEFKTAFIAAIYGVRSQYEKLLAREESLKKALQEQEQQAFQLTRQLVRYNDMKRNVEADQQIYESVIARMKEASMVETLPSDVIRLAEEALPGRRPVRPDRTRVLIRGVMIGLGAGLGIIFLLYYTDHRFRRNEEIERSMGVSVLAALPVIQGRSVRERGMIAYEQPTGEVAEAFRTLRTIIGINPAVKTAKVLLLTSTQPSEGKTLVSVNLALSYAQDNRRTLLIGADLRRPTFNKIFKDLQLHQGLSDVLLGSKSWKEALQAPSIPNLDVLSSGSTVDRPVELLGSSRFLEMLTEMRNDYDQIIIDAPPVLGISDTLVMLKHADGVLFVVRYGVTHSLGAVQAMKRVVASGTPCIGAVMNSVDLRSLANSYYYRRYGGYAYHQYTRKVAGHADGSDDGDQRRGWRWPRKRESKTSRV